MTFHCKINTTFATALRDWRLEHSVPLKKIAAELGVSIATVNTWERGKRFPSVQHIERLANYIGVPPCRLFCAQADACVPKECRMTRPENS